MRLTPTGKIVLLILALGVAVGGWRWWQRSGSGLMSTLAPAARVKESVVPPKADLPTAGSPSTPAATNRRG